MRKTTLPALLAFALAPWFAVGISSVQAAPLDEQAALTRSQAVLGTDLGDHVLTDRQGRTVRLSTLLDRPTVISLIYTSCYHTCPVITKHLGAAAEHAREVLGEDSFNLVTVGFDAANDDPDAMREFARRQNVDGDHWYFLSGDARTVAALVDELGFTFQPSPHGFDHLTQATVIESGGTVYRQVYGEIFELPWLVEPLKDLVFGRPAPDSHMLDQLVGRIRLFCTVYDPTTGRYEFDYSLFIQIGIGAMIVVSVATYLVREAIRARRSRRRLGKPSAH